ncbi:MAG: hypothetical protein K0Q73_7524 [Paenibacillus sp.]|jgi:hypothetical protein|nr:hypothetical protein [Paenibacillus sp.]
MKRAIVIAVLLIMVFTNAASAEWAYRFVVYSGNVYVVTDSAINSDQIDTKIGQVTHYSDREGTYKGNFSNTYPKGTPYYSIVGINENQGIAVKNDEAKFIKAVYQGPYAGNESDNYAFIWILLISGGAAVVLFFVISGRLKKSKA